MKKILSFALICAFANLAFAQTEISISYSYAWFEPLHKKLKQDFEKENPDVKINIRGATPTYEEGTSKLMREKIVNQLPDISFASFNYILPLSSKDIPLVINDIFTEEDKVQGGFTESFLSPTTINGKIYGIPFAASMPIFYYNMDLVKKAGWNKELPKTWAEVFELSKMINKLDGKFSMYLDIYTDNWMFMALVMSQGGDFIKDGKVGFNNKIGLWSVKKMSQMKTIANMPNFNNASAKKSFIAGNLGIYIASSAAVKPLEDAIANNFELKTTKFVEVKENGKLPVGGSVALLTSRDDNKKQIAIKYLKYITGKEGNANVPLFTGYMPPNQEALKKLKDFYAKNKNQQTAPSQLNFMGAWPSYPGDNALKISDVIYDYGQLLLRGERKDYEKVLEEMTQKVNKLLP